MEGEEIWIQTADNVKLQAYWLPTVNPRTNPTILFFHENAGNLGHRLPNIQRIIESVNCNVLIISYRGYAKSEGYPSEKGLRLDAEAAYSYILLRKDVDTKKIFFFWKKFGGSRLHIFGFETR